MSLCEAGEEAWPVQVGVRDNQVNPHFTALAGNEHVATSSQKCLVGEMQPWIRVQSVWIRYWRTYEQPSAYNYGAQLLQTSLRLYWDPWLLQPTLGPSGSWGSIIKSFNVPMYDGKQTLDYVNAFCNVFKLLSI